jgi:hypothetical protein
MTITPALAALADERRTEAIMARLDAIWIKGYVTGPGLDYADMRVGALFLADHYTDRGTRLTATGRNRDEVFWWYYNGATYDLMNAYGSARLRSGAIERPDPGAEHYVTVNDGERIGNALGPYLTDEEAGANVDRVRAFLEANDSHSGAYEYGTFRVRGYGRNLGPGRLNARIGLRVPRNG